MGADTPPRFAAVYCRVSTDQQEERGTSLEGQEARGRRRAAELGWADVRVFRDTHSGADLFGRRALSDLRAAVRAGEAGVVVVTELDRLSRKQIHQGLLLSELEHAGVPLDLTDERLEDTPEGRLLLSVRGFVAEIEREKIRDRTQGGKRRRLEAGKIVGQGTDLYGYRRDKEAGVRVVHDGEAAIVRRVFREAVAEGRPIRGIAAGLNAEGVPPPSAGKRVFKDAARTPRWGHSVVRRILREPAYKGETWALRRRACGKKQHEFRDPSEWIRLPDHVTPALVTASTWQAAQDRLDASSAAVATRNAARPYLLRGYVVCAVCGRKMHSCPEHGRRVYRCSSRQTAAGACGAGRVPAQDVEDWVWGELAGVLGDPARIAAEAQRRRDTGDAAADRDAAARLVARLDKQAERLVRRYAEAADDDGFPWDVVEREIARVEADRRAARATLAETEGHLAAQRAAVVRLDTVRAYCERVRDRLGSLAWQNKRDAVEALVERVVADGRDWRLEGSVPGDGGTVTTTSAGCGRRPRPPPAPA